MDIKTLFDVSESREYSMNNIVYLQKDKSDFIYLVKKGDFQISKSIMCYQNDDDQIVSEFHGTFNED